jgi:chaperonin GroEL (HSP60 family)
VALEADACEGGFLVKLYLREHPENRHSVASSLIVAALKEKFPCRE